MQREVPMAKVAEVVAHFALVESRFFLRMDKLHRVFQRHNMDRFGFIQLVQQRGQRRGFPASGCTRNEDESVFSLAIVWKIGGRLQLIDAGDIGRQFSKNDRVVAALRKDVDAEARLHAQGIGAVA